jgi:uncharacterized low-complexity protein
MNKKTLALTLGGAIVTALTASPIVNAQGNPFGLQKISGAQVLAAADEKMPEGSSKMKEGGCSGATTPAPETKIPEGGCSGKMKEGSCSGKM